MERNNAVASLVPVARTSSRKKDALSAFMAGASSAACSTLLFQPLDLVKTRMQVRAITAPLCLATATIEGGTAAAGMFGTFLSVVQKENFAALWKGTSPSLQRSIPGIGVYFASLSFLKAAIGKTDRDLTAVQALCVGATARSLTASSFIPVTVVKTRFESGRYQYRSVLHGITTIAQTEGFKGLFSGLSATLARDAPFSGLYLLFYTQSKQMALKATQLDRLSPPLLFSCGVMAGLLASIITQPADVVKTSVQLRAHNSIIRAILTTLQRSGPRGFFVGFLPRATRRTLMAAFTWSFYEQIVVHVQSRLERLPL